MPEAASLPQNFSGWLRLNNQPDTLSEHKLNTIVAQRNVLNEMCSFSSALSFTLLQFMNFESVRLLVLLNILFLLSVGNNRIRLSPTRLFSDTAFSRKIH